MIDVRAQVLGTNSKEIAEFAKRGLLPQKIVNKNLNKNFQSLKLFILSENCLLQSFK